MGTDWGSYRCTIEMTGHMWSSLSSQNRKCSSGILKPAENQFLSCWIPAIREKMHNTVLAKKKKILAVLVIES